MRKQSNLAARELTQPLLPGFDAETMALIAAKPTRETAKKLGRKFELFLGAIRRQQPFDGLEQHFKDALETAARDPVALYRFFQLYNYFNGGIAPAIAPLVGNIGKSRDLFTDPETPVTAEASYAFAIAREVQKASTDEYGDPNYRDLVTGQKLDHRRLSDGLMKAVGNYAGLSDQERNGFEVPAWLVANKKDIQKLYAGAEGNLAKLAQALGMHFTSEYSADAIEFSNACKSLFIDHKNEGLHHYLCENPYISVGGNTFAAHSWLQTHGGWDAEKNEIRHGVEYVHLVTGFAAMALMVGKAGPEKKMIAQKNFLEGIRNGQKLLDDFFIGAKAECEKILAARDVPVPGRKTARHLSAQPA